MLVVDLPPGVSLPFRKRKPEDAMLQDRSLRERRMNLTTHSAVHRDPRSSIALGLGWLAYALVYLMAAVLVIGVPAALVVIAIRMAAP